MKKLLIILLVCLNVSLFAQERECQKFRHGNFEMTTERGTYYIKRKGKKQIETKKGSKAKTFLKVTWLSDCEYSLKLIREVGRKSSFSKETILFVEIVQLKESSYVQITTSNIYDFETEGEMKLIKSN